MAKEEGGRAEKGHQRSPAQVAFPLKNKKRKSPSWQQSVAGQRIVRVHERVQVPAHFEYDLPMSAVARLRETDGEEAGTRHGTPWGRNDKD